MRRPTQKLFNVLVLGGCAVVGKLGCDGTQTDLDDTDDPVQTRSVDRAGSDPSTESGTSSDDDDDEPAAVVGTDAAGAADPPASTIEAGAPLLDGSGGQEDLADGAPAVLADAVDPEAGADAELVSCWCSTDPCCVDNAEGTRSVMAGFKCCWGPC